MSAEKQNTTCERESTSQQPKPCIFLHPLKRIKNGCWMSGLEWGATIWERRPGWEKHHSSMSECCSTLSLITAVLPRNTRTHARTHTYTHTLLSLEKKKKNQRGRTKAEVVESANTQQGGEKSRAQGCGGQTGPSARVMKIFIEWKYHHFS